MTKRLVEIASLARAPSASWSDYPAGVLWSLRKEGIVVSGFNMSLTGDVPLGAGLSSSASVEVATAMALLGRAAVELPLEKVATLCRRAENEYVGAKERHYGPICRYRLRGEPCDAAGLPVA